MKKILLSLSLACIVSSAYGRTIKIHLAMPESPTVLESQNNDVHVEMAAQPCAEMGIQMDCKIYAETSNGKRLISNPSIIGKYGQTACVSMENEENEKLDVTIDVVQSDEPSMNVEVLE